MISIIVAIDEKRGIGKGNDLLFRIPEDFKRMQAITIGHPIIMGRKTYESIGRVLPKRTNIIVTRDVSYKVDGAIVTDSLEKAIEIAKKTEESRIKNQESSREESPSHDSYFMIHNSRNEEIFIFGGGQLFKEAIEKGIVDKLYLTVVKGDFGADTFFLEYKKLFSNVLHSETKQDEKYIYTFEDRTR